ncbi:nucleotidyltransferase [Sinorhizobium medicae]|uniref:CBASS oligonucleotide cyclase n=1 Tax=Sinorhizobium medicae TaxID=110321 RepID=UPI000FD3CD31|nr:CBASS oligonucleotide cyclase [Sinorhizobium medicae]MDX0586882.1 nucleotidyltransferase [Sinorhizobium medicae]MDX0679971.1 nucleotidyltransferase [Sinorhizobium medicae]MDX0712506.1 nucleotidyltransferase [Sinorhizobium medicae]MDX0842393.1 nucleotidyltransferase [Sinorhizobium medicae]MQV97657.1 nucleotidyltransferase [Sinorhizobium medicae]
MVTTVADAFRQFRTNLEITSLQESTTSTRQTNVRDAVASDFFVLESFLTGSYRRNTMIAPLSTADVDVFIVLDPKYYAVNNQSALLSAVVGTLKKEYPKTPKIKPDGQAVTITFTDFKVDVVPGFYRTGGGYLIPDANMGRWMPTDPRKHVELWTASNKAHNGSLIPLIKMMKCWNRANKEMFRSFHLEVLVRHVLTDVTITDFPSGARWVFDKMREKVWSKVADPAGYSDDIALYLAKSTADKMIAALDRAYQSAVMAENYAHKGSARLAIEEWRSVFGDYFPAYG